MAAYASLVIFTRNIDPIHGDLNHIHHGLVFKPLYEKVVQLLAIMEDCPGETLSQEFEARIRDYAYRANNIIETHYIQLLKGWDNRQRRKVGHIIQTRCIHLLKGWDTRLRKRARGKFRKLTDEATSLVVEAQNLRGVVETNDPVMEFKESSSSLYAPGGATKKVRLYSDVTKLREKLYQGSTQREVIPIVGMGGSGKTTIASVLFQDSYSVRRFDRRVWITVSQNYDKCTLLSQILKSLNESALRTYEDLGVKVHQTLKWRRYLVVIDDVWSEKLWDDINIFLPDDAKGSRILLTTRLENVANYVVSSTHESYIHTVELMNLSSSWSLLKETVFGMDRECPVELEEIGKSIAKDCARLPLAIVVIAGVLSSTNNRKDLWEKIAADVKTAMNLSLSRILSLSYSNLPHHLKPCFLHLACFPEDYKIEVSNLIMLWAAEGFLKLSKSHMSEEEVAYEYLDDLVKKNLVLVSEKKYNGRISYCHLHDMIRDLCVETAAKENFIILAHDNCRLSSNENDYHIRFSISSSFSAVQQLCTAHVRSALFVRGSIMFDTYTEELLWMRFRLLRVLDIQSINLPGFPYQVCQLFLLRYLAIQVKWEDEDMFCSEVPSSIKKLKHLQVLHVTGEYFDLPLEIWEMPELRHLIGGVQLLGLPDPPIGKRSSSSSSSSLENLQSLIGVVNIKITEHLLQVIPNVKMLNIAVFEFMGEYCLPNLARFAYLEALEIRSGDFSRRNILLPPSLKELVLESCRFTWSDLGTVAGLLQNLEFMRLLDNVYEGDVWEVKEGEFSTLKVLEIYDEGLVIWKYDGEGGYIFPSLEELHLYHFNDLIEFPECIGEIDTLRLIRVHQCNELLTNWAIEVKEVQESYGNEDLQVIITENLTIDSSSD